MTARTGPPAMTPVPAGAGFSSTRPLPYTPRTVCWMVVASTCTRRKFFLAASMPFLIAAGTSLALPVPKPTILAPGSPTTTSAEKLRFLPPLTTLVTRLIETTCSFRFRLLASMRLAAVNDMSSFPSPQPVRRRRRGRHASGLTLQSRFAGRLGQRFHAAVILISAAIEHHGFNALVFGPLGHQLANDLGPGHVAAAAAGLFGS